MLKPILIVLLCAFCAPVAMAAFGGHPPLGPDDKLRRILQPYDLAKLSYLGMNYCENLLDLRVNTCSYTHLGYDRNQLDAWHLHFGDDCGRLVEAIAWEDQFSPVVRLEFARRLVKGAISSHVPGTRAYYFFRHRSGGKTFIMSDDEATSKQGRLLLVNLGDAPEDGLKVGFRMARAGRWSDVEQFKRTDEPANPGHLGTARSARYWHESPFVFKRRYTGESGTVSFLGKYWLSDEDMPFEFAFESTDADRLEIVIGEPGKPMPLLRDASVPGVIHLPDRKTTFTSADGDRVIENPDFNYFILRKPTAWACPGYSTALLVMWEGRPDRIEALKQNGFGEIRISYPRHDGRAGGRAWLFPFQWVNHNDMAYIYRNAESFLKSGKLIHNGFPTQQLVNAIPGGLAAGAYLLAKYGDPMATTARIHAINACDELFDAEQDDMKLVRVFLCVKAAAWMVKLGNQTGDKAMVDKYTPILDREMRRMTAPESGYDGKGWPSGWDHFNNAKAAWLAYDAAGRKEYLDVYNRALQVYTIDSKGIYRDGVAMQAPGGFETYAGALPLSLWGHAGKLDWVNTLINLDVPSGWHDPQLPVKDNWHDGGAGPWAQDDSQPDFVGFCLKGLNMPQDRKYVLPLGAFPTYDASGKVVVTRGAIVENEFFSPGKDPVLELPRDRAKMVHDVSTVAGGGSTAEFAAGSRSYTCRFDTKGAAGAGLDLRIKGSYRIEASPDGKRWFTRLDTWSDDVREQSLDLSWLTGGRDELVKIAQFDGSDVKHLQPGGKSSVERGQCRYVQPGGSFVYKLDMPDVVECRIELLVGNGYRVQCSSDGRTWTDGLDADHPGTEKTPDAGWLRMLDVTPHLERSKTVFLKFSDVGKTNAYGGKSAFLRRLTAYGVFNSGSVFVRLLDTSEGHGQLLALRRLTFRTWHR